MNKRLLGVLAVACALAFPLAAAAQTYPGVAQSSLGQNRDVTPVTTICSGGVPCPSGTAASPTYAVTQPTTTAIASAQQTCTASAAILPTTTYSNGFVITAMTSNTGTAYTGGSGVTTATGYPLLPGQSIAYNAANSNQVYLICDGTTDKIAITGN